MIRLVPYLSNLLTAAFLFLAALLFAFCLQTWIPVLKKKPYDKGLLLAAAFFVTAPSLAEQYAYTLQAFEITLSMCICMIAVYCAGRAVYGNGSVIWYLAAVLLLSQDITCSAGMMEAFLLSIVILFLAIKRGILPGKKRLLYLAADGLPDGKRGDRLYCQQYSAGTAWLFIVGWGKDQ